jgi:hypothetical protein
VPNRSEHEEGHLPVVIRVVSGQLHASPEIAQLVDDVRGRADVFVFLSGGASKISEPARRTLLGLLDALPILVDRGVRIAAGDGGTKAGLMEAAGIARLKARTPFPLVGVAPAPETTTGPEPGKTELDPNHSHVVVVENPLWIKERRRAGWTPDQGYWGSEVDTMRDLFDRLSRERPSVAIVANGGAVTLQEVRMHVESGRTMIVVADSGRAADALISVLRGTEPADDEIRELSEAARSADLFSRRELYKVFTAADGAAALADTVARHLTPRRPR